MLIQDTLDAPTQSTKRPPMRFAWLEITPNCQLTCQHCYVASGPGLGHGNLRLADWKRTMDSLRSLGVQTVQFIGGEPTTHPQFCDLVDYAAGLGFTIEVFSNLVGITARMWDTFTRHNVSVATSFYSAEADVHDAITQLRGSHRKTVTNIKRVLALGLRLRVGLIDVRDDQDMSGARAFLEELGVDRDRIGTDRVRGVGRGFTLSPEDNLSALCGKCVSGNCTVTADGTVYPCIMARSFPVGNVLRQPIDDVLAGEPFLSTYEVLHAAFSRRAEGALQAISADDREEAMPPPCMPQRCMPSSGCAPQRCLPRAPSCYPGQLPGCYPGSSCYPMSPCAPRSPLPCGPIRPG